MCSYDLTRSLQTLLRVYHLLELEDVEAAKKDLTTEIQVIRLHLQANEE